VIGLCALWQHGPSAVLRPELRPGPEEELQRGDDIPAHDVTVQLLRDGVVVAHACARGGTGAGVKVMVEVDDYARLLAGEEVALAEHQSASEAGLT
jgi:hypothetical protein